MMFTVLGTHVTAASLYLAFEFHWSCIIAALFASVFWAKAIEAGKLSAQLSTQSNHEEH